MKDDVYSAKFHTLHIMTAFNKDLTGLKSRAQKAKHWRANYNFVNRWNNSLSKEFEKF